MLSKKWKKRIRRVKIYNRTFDVGQIFSGFGLIGFNLIGFAATEGIVVDGNNAVTSVLSGTGLALNGMRAANNRKTDLENTDNK